MEITAIKTQTKNENRASIYTDGKFYKGVDKLVAMKLGLRTGLILTPILIDKLEKQETTNNVWEYALRLMEASPKNSRRMFERLKDKFDEDAARITVKKLIDARIIDDQRLADGIVANFISQGSKSRRQIKLYLMTKRFSSDVIELSLENITQNYDTESATMSAHHKYRQLKDMDWQTKSKKIYAYLAGRGFNYDVIKQVVNREILDIDSE